MILAYDIHHGIPPATITEKAELILGVNNGPPPRIYVLTNRYLDLEATIKEMTRSENILRDILSKRKDVLPLLLGVNEELDSRIEKVLKDETEDILDKV